VIANAGVSLGDWKSMTPEWQEAAEKWRDEWHKMLSANAAADLRRKENDGHEEKRG
jgi:hypothetical protein